MADRSGAKWQLNVSMALVALVLVLIGGYFYQSYLVVRESAPVEVAVEVVKERLKARPSQASETTGAK